MSTAVSIGSAVTFVPFTGKFYVGSLINEGSKDGGISFQGRAEKALEPIAILNREELAKGNRQAAVEYVNDELLRQADRALFNPSNRSVQAAVDVTSLAKMTRVELLTEIINRQYKDVFLINGVTKRPVPKLKLDQDVQLHIKTRGKDALVKKRQKGNVEAPEVIQFSFDMVKFGKLMRVIDTTDEDELSALISPMSIALDDIAQVMSQDENSLILDAMNLFVVKSKASWSGKNTNEDFSKNNPLEHITAELERIAKNHGKPKFVAANMATWGSYSSNTHTQGYEKARQRPIGGGLTGLEDFPGLTAIIDVDLPGNTAYVFDPRALQYGEGPMVSETFRDPFTGVSGNVVRKWVEPVVPKEGSKLDLGDAFASKMTSL